ncbi:hypothetical protein LTR36_002616 [Oleoguttula mirabilis]|uniref:Uncharacterized protein n=1 Tax=Oleoguttula mirabilis TaxID=1507867 RepID=A0AAV9JKG0_9PEZI|nr:hypothetical protein LTR36_002616 [Oleoguttula mirabilis]
MAVKHGLEHLRDMHASSATSLKLHTCLCSSPLYITATPLPLDESSRPMQTLTRSRKKYFSSVERLRIAQQYAAQKRKKQCRTQTWLFSSSSTDLTSESASEPRPSTSNSTKRQQIKLQADASSVHTVEPIDTEMAILKLYSSRRVSMVPEVSSSPPPPPTWSSLAPPIRSHDRLKRESFHRALSLTPLALPSPTLAPIPPTPSPSTIKHFVVSARLSRPYIDSVPLSPEQRSEARYYQDPDARRQLRQYLASPQKFDEAIEFGFPSSCHVAPSSSGTDRSFPIQKTPSPGGYDIDDASIDSHGPPTPTEEPDGRHRPIVLSASPDSGIALPFQLNAADKADGNSTASFGGSREMTLRMTLTRPELRMSEEPHGVYRRTKCTTVKVPETDPLALETLSICDDHTGAHGAFAMQGSDQKKGLKRVWKSMRRR